MTELTMADMKMLLEFHADRLLYIQRTIGQLRADTLRLLETFDEKYDKKAKTTKSI